MARGRDRLHLWIPVVAAAVTVLLFFYIARLRVVMIPSLGVFAGAGIAGLVAAYRGHQWRRVTGLAAAAILGAGLAAFPLLQSDTSNEWAKAGGVLRLAGDLQGAEAAFVRGGEENPGNPNVWLSLASLYRATGRDSAADSAQARAQELLSSAEQDGTSYRRALEGGP